jgi:hypothetical protein
MHPLGLQTQIQPLTDLGKLIARRFCGTHDSLPVRPDNPKKSGRAAM